MNEDASRTDGVLLPLMVAADLQDHLLIASNDLDRLQTLLSDACDSLIHSFSNVSDQLRGLLAHESEPTALVPAEPIHLMLQQLGGAVTALQFQDMATQLIAHTRVRLRNCSDKLAHQTFESDDDEAALIDDTPMRANPVTQAEMDAGSVELF